MPVGLSGALLALLVLLAACSPKRESAGEAAPAKAVDGSPSVLNPKATIDNVQKRVDEAAAKDAKRREEMEAQTK